MPKYTVRDPATGRTVVLQGDSPPTEQELETIFQELPAAAQPAQTGPARPLPFGAEGLRPGLELATGIVKGAANTITGLGEAAYKYLPGVAAVSDATQRAIFGDVVPGTQSFPAARQMVQPTTPLQQIGYTGEQIAEYFIPTTRAARFVRAAEAAKAGGIALAQSGDPTTAGISGGIAAVLPGGAPASRAAGALSRSAQKSMVGALGPTKEWAKEEAKTLAPGMLAGAIGGPGGRLLPLAAPVRGSRIQMLEQARAMTKDVGAQIGTAVQAAAAAGQTVPGATIAQTIQAGRDALMTPNAAGTLIPIAGTEPVIRQLNRLRTFVMQLPADIPLDQAAKIKTTWDRIVSKAGLYGPKAQASATDSAAAWSIREATNSFRDLIAKGNVTIDELNQHYKFWKGLRNVLAETERRTQSHGGGLISGVTGGAGVVAGLVSGEGVGDKMQDALVYGVMGRQLVRLLQSPSWATRVSAPLKQALANALASGSTARVTSVMQQMSRALPAQVQQAVGAP